MTTKLQSNFISDLAVIHTKEFKEVKEVLVSSGIVSDNAEIVANAQSLAEITNALTDEQASKFIDTLTAKQIPDRSKTYSQKRVQKTVDALDGIKSKIAGWNFEL